MGERRETYGPVVLEQLDRAPLGDRPHDEPGDLQERRLPVERAPEHAPDVGEEAKLLLALALLGHVLDHVDREDRQPVRVAYRRRLDQRPHVVARLSVAVAQERGARVLTAQRTPPGEVLDRERLTGLVV